MSLVELLLVAAAADLFDRARKDETVLWSERLAAARVVAAGARLRPPTEAEIWARIAVKGVDSDAAE